MYLTKTFFVQVVLFIVVISIAYGAQPIDLLKEPIDKIINILNDSQYKKAGQKAIQREKIWGVIRKVFDFSVIAKLALGKNRKSFSNDQLDEFTVLFTELLGNTYISKIQGNFRNEKIAYLDQKMVTESKARVKTEIIRENSVIPVVYSIRNKNGQWKIYDIKVEGVSLVKNYRSQFDKILFNKKPEHLIERLRAKIAKQKKSLDAQK